MGRRAKKQPGEIWDRITQACPGAKTRFDPLIVPELIAFLEMKRRNYSQMIDRLSILPERDRTEYTRGMIRHYTAAAVTCGELIDAVTQRWSRHTWLGIVAEIDTAMKTPGKVVPPEPAAEPSLSEG